jgi:hypothetical protein
MIKVFAENAHDEDLLRKLLNEYLSRRGQGNPQREERSTKTVKIPFVPVLSSKLRAALKERGIKTVFTPSLKYMLCRHKTALPPNSFPEIFSVKCECGVQYIRESKKRISTRLQQHEKDIFHGRSSNSGITEHAGKCDNNRFVFEEENTIAYESDWRRRKVREALEIKRNNRDGVTTANCDEGSICTTTAWNVLLARMTSTSR